MKILKYIWELPQNLVGEVLKLFIKGKERKVVGGINIYYKKGFPGAISLGNTIISGTNYISTIKHEHGHQIQSMYLGPLYLFIIGIPSIIWAGLHSYIPSLRRANYYSFYTEKWADKLGGVKRKTK